MVCAFAFLETHFTIYKETVMSQYYPSPGSDIQKPGEVTAITIMTLISGITNILAAFTWSITLPIVTLGIGCLCVPITVLPGVLGVFEIIYASKLLSNPPKPVRPSQTIAILEIVAILSGNIFSLGAGILALVMYNDPKVKDFFARINPIVAPSDNIPPAS
jgi:hypothetical protein